MFTDDMIVSDNIVSCDIIIATTLAITFIIIVINITSLQLHQLPYRPHIHIITTTTTTKTITHPLSLQPLLPRRLHRHLQLLPTVQMGRTCPSVGLLAKRQKRGLLLGWGEVVGGQLCVGTGLLGEDYRGRRVLGLDYLYDRVGVALFCENVVVGVKVVAIVVVNVEINSIGSFVMLIDFTITTTF